MSRCISLGALVVSALLLVTAAHADDSRQLLESRDPNLHDLIWDVILERGEGTIVPFSGFSEADFAQRIQAYPKIILKF